MHVNNKTDPEIILILHIGSLGSKSTCVPDTKRDSLCPINSSNWGMMSHSHIKLWIDVARKTYWIDLSDWRFAERRMCSSRLRIMALDWIFPHKWFEVAQAEFVPDRNRDRDSGPRKCWSDSQMGLCKHRQGCSVAAIALMTDGRRQGACARSWDVVSDNWSCLIKPHNLSATIVCSLMQRCKRCWRTPSAL